MFYFDVHCHILPGVDDGAKNINITMDMIDFAYDEGIRAMILTPHYHGGYVETPRHVIDETYMMLRDAVARRHPDMRLFIGNEIYYYPSVPDWIAEGRVHSLADSAYVLLEFSNSVEKRTLKEAVQNINSYGYYPILAHVERYNCLVKDPYYVEELVTNGALIQCNAKAIIGDEGLRARHFTRKLLKYEMVHFVGTDAHSMGSRKPEMADCADYLIKKFGKDYAARLLYANAVCIINNAPIQG